MLIPVCQPFLIQRAIVSGDEHHARQLCQKVKQALVIFH
jgi:hypothetical protein